eukprot:896485-Amphidinium_carterae.1
MRVLRDEGLHSELQNDLDHGLGVASPRDVCKGAARAVKIDSLKRVHLSSNTSKHIETQSAAITHTHA